MKRRSSTSREVDSIKKKILVRGTDDWVHDSEACYVAREAAFGVHLRDGFPRNGTLDADRLTSARTEWTASQERQVFPLALEAIKELVRDGLVEIGSVTQDGFVAWAGSVEELESRLDGLNEEANFPLMPGDLFWLSNTPLGDEKVGE